MYKPEHNFRDAKEAYPSAEDSDYMSFGSDYGKVLHSMNLYPVVFVEEEDYQGESLVLLYNQRYNYGILNFSWGSCDGCDMLQACTTEEEFDEFRHDLFNKIHWGNQPNGSLASHIIEWWLNRDVDGLEAVSGNIKDKFNKMLELYSQDANFHEERKQRARDFVYKKLLAEKDANDLIHILNHEDLYGKSFYKIDADFMRGVLYD